MVTDNAPNPASESTADETKIIGDQDQTFENRNLKKSTTMGSGPANWDLEDEPDDFARGEIDVMTQIDRTIRISRANAEGHHDLDDSPDMTPGGIEEVAAKTDQDLAVHGYGRRHPRQPAERRNR
jgi:hypothetical protein